MLLQGSLQVSTTKHTWSFYNYVVFSIYILCILDGCCLFLAVKVSDLSSQYTDLVGGVLATLRNCEWKLPEDESFFSQTPDPYSLSRQEAIRAVREALACSDAVRALQLVRFFRYV